MQTVNMIRINVPYDFRHLRPEIKSRGGQFDGDTKEWLLPDNEANKAFVAQLRSRAKPLAPPQERVESVAKTTVELLNALRIGRYQLRESTVTRVLIEREAGI